MAMIHMTMNYTFECEIQNPVKYISKYSIIIKFLNVLFYFCLLYTSDAADEVY